MKRLSDLSWKELQEAAVFGEAVWAGSLVPRIMDILRTGGYIQAAKEAEIRSALQIWLDRDKKQLLDVDGTLENILASRAAQGAL